MPTLEINTNIGCKLACTFCPQDKIVKNYKDKDNKNLSFEKFEFYLSKIPKHVRIDFSGMTEPFLNPETHEFINYSYEKGYLVSIYTTLVGLKPKKAKEILDRWGNKISNSCPWVIHLPDATNNMRGWKKTDEYMETLNCFIDYKKKSKNENLKFMTMDPEGFVNEEIKEIFNLKIPNFFASSRAENLNREKTNNLIIEKKIKISNPVMCKSTPFYDHNNLLPNGDIILCCMDYSLGNKLGNLNENSYYEILSGKKMNDIRMKAMQFGYDENFICKNCTNAVELKNNNENWYLDENVHWQNNDEKIKNDFLFKENISLKEKLGKNNVSFLNKTKNTVISFIGNILKKR